MVDAGWVALVPSAACVISGRMAETLLDVRALSKADAYAALSEQLDAILIGVTDEVCVMATIACVIHHGFDLLWSGFYRVVNPKLLRVGPYQGSLGCLEIEFGRGVCGTAAVERRTLVVPDVYAFPGHITCDARSRSEIVVPVFDHSGALLAVLDLDSDHLGAFDEIDARALERIVKRFACRLR
jgi:L-methionine (R)-S-oxide reductase